MYKILETIRLIKRTARCDAADIDHDDGVCKQIIRLHYALINPEFPSAELQRFIDLNLDDIHANNPDTQEYFVYAHENGVIDCTTQRPSLSENKTMSRDEYVENLNTFIKAENGYVRDMIYKYTGINPLNRYIWTFTGQRYATTTPYTDEDLDKIRANLSHLYTFNSGDVTVIWCDKFRE